MKPNLTTPQWKKKEKMMFEKMLSDGKRFFNRYKSNKI